MSERLREWLINQTDLVKTDVPVQTKRVEVRGLWEC